MFNIIKTKNEFSITALNDYSQTELIISILLIFILLIQLSDCVCYKIISGSDHPEHIWYEYIIHMVFKEYDNP
jgi:hypothetical protein